MLAVAGPEKTGVDLPLRHPELAEAERARLVDMDERSAAVPETVPTA